MKLNRKRKLPIALAVWLTCLGRAFAAVPTGNVAWIDNNGIIAGWAKDPDDPNVAIQVHIYAGNDAPTVLCGATTADRQYASPVGQHGFRFMLPENIRVYHRKIWVYGIDTDGGPNALIANGNPYPSEVNVSGADNSVQHQWGAPYQLGQVDSNLLAGGRPGNKAYSYKFTQGPWFRGTGMPWWYCGYGPIRVTAAPRLAGAISSIIWDNVEFLDSEIHGAAMTYFAAGPSNSDLDNATEEGSHMDSAWANYGTTVINLTAIPASKNPTDHFGPYHYYSTMSSSQIQLMDHTGNILHTKTRAAYWVPRPPAGVTQWPGVYPNRGGQFTNAI